MCPNEKKTRMLQFSNPFSLMDDLFSKIKQHFNGTWDAVESDKATFESIVMRLPIKSILTFKSISKFWYKIMSTKDFIVMHRFWSKKNTKLFTFYDAGDLDDGIVREMHLMEPNGTYSESYMIPGFETLHNPILISSFNGLICCVNYMTPCRKLHDAEVRICNPATRKVLLLPNSHLSAYMPIFGVLYSNKYHMYKVFKFFSDLGHYHMGYSQCEVYSSKTGEWKPIGRISKHPLMNPTRPLVADHVCVNEKLYIFIGDDVEFDMPSAILMVDMDCNFYEIPLPTDVEISFLIEFQGQLCLVDWTGVSFYIWIYHENNTSWYLKDTPLFPSHHWLEVSHFDSVVALEHKILFVYKDRVGLRHEILYDVVHATWEDFRIDESAEDKSIVVFPFFETLVPCTMIRTEISTPVCHPNRAIEKPEAHIIFLVSGSSTKSTSGLSSNMRLQQVPSLSQFVTDAVTPKNILNPTCLKEIVDQEGVWKNVGRS
ncbi:hypothetical protein LXL04_037504 [Taraxacum kok-saghyz]